MKSTAPKTISVGQKTAVYSFVFGTMILLIFLLSKYTPLVAVGLYYVLAASVFNMLILLTLLIQFMYYKEHRKKILTTVTFMLLNIPISILYFFIVIN
ncbi:MULTISPECIES: hypothetical protein [unclassified Pedobacter]|uniref:hypothetical protein n=1 Tax=unclassified Pedobacter TaxID=2628915 RepID=UPI00141FB0B6|nr:MULTISPECIES: hypothetical protein [unclassified Pedobacter]NII81933.1 uncharacterized membrane protein (DUF373 family) [Pedobacter sp. SG908]NMN35936.1 uncharacterized membrane protein (DUF373 family) [Pedobacter sp. SG918]